MGVGIASGEGRVEAAIKNAVESPLLETSIKGAKAVLLNIVGGVDALLHVSQISKDHIEKPSDVLKVGDEVTAKIVDFNMADKKISLSVKAMFEPEKTDV